ncbi:Hypothetical protein D9617_1g080040 [Elsinoe fawcettii]|nr:Hypothetical protein D9617_1g080040 [Elsinoe fawcettii]
MSTTTNWEGRAAARAEREEEEDSWTLTSPSSRIVGEEDSSRMALLDDVVWDEAETAARLRGRSGPEVRIISPSPPPEQGRGEVKGWESRVFGGGLFVGWMPRQEMRRRREEEEARWRRKAERQWGAWSRAEAERRMMREEEERTERERERLEEEGRQWVGRLARLDTGWGWW